LKTQADRYTVPLSQTDDLNQLGQLQYLGATLKVLLNRNSYLKKAIYLFITTMRYWILFTYADYSHWKQKNTAGIAKKP